MLSYRTIPVVGEAVDPLFPKVLWRCPFPLILCIPPFGPESYSHLSATLPDLARRRLLPRARGHVVSDHKTPAFPDQPRDAAHKLLAVSPDNFCCKQAIGQRQIKYDKRRGYQSSRPICALRQPCHEQLVYEIDNESDG